MKINTKKCEFFKISIIYLDQIIDEQGIRRPDQYKIKAIIESDSLTNKKKLNGLIGSINQYRD